MDLRPRQGAPRFRGDGGATIVEATIIGPLIFVIFLAVFEFGLIFRDRLTVQDAAADAARTGGIVGPDQFVTGENGDFEVIENVREATGGIPVDWIERIVIFEGRPPGAGSAVDQLASACKTGGSNTARNCNVYDPHDAFLAVQDGDVAYFQCTDGTQRSCGWDPNSRDDGPVVADIDYLGVYIKVDRPYISKLFGDQVTIQVASIVRLEPGSTG